MSGDPSEGEKVTGCFIAVWALVVTTPMWLVLLFALMQANEMPAWAWVLYWCYVPANIFGLLAMNLAKMLLTGKL